MLWSRLLWNRRRDLIVRYALISDIHANLPALEAVLADIQSDGRADAIYHLGDLVGYAPWPNEVVALIRSDGIAGVAGNYDSTVATSYKHCGCRYEDAQQEALSHRSYEWTREHTADSAKRWLGALPFRIDLRPLGGHVSGPTVTLVHGNQTLNTVYVTEDRSDDFLSKMAGDLGARSGDVVVCGHTHRPWHRAVNGVHVINAGSVGRPKDGDWRACYMMLDVTPSSINVEHRRVEYDVERTAQAIVDSELPNELADFLRTGGGKLQ